MSKSLPVIALLASLTLGGCLGGVGEGEVLDQSAYERGKLHFNAGRFGLAVNHFQSAVRREPSSVVALNGLAASYDRLGRYDLSARYYQRALAADPESAQTLNNIGYSYLLQERFDLAVAYLRDAQARDGEDSVVLANRRVAEVSYQDADLKRSAEEARTKQSATPASNPSPPQVAAQAPVSPAALAPSRRVKPWIERTAPKIQTLVTQPQVALLGAVVEVGIAPQLAAYRPQQPTAAELLPEHVAAPMVPDARQLPERSDAVRQEVRSAPTGPVAPRAPDQGQSIPVTGLAPTEVTVASLNPLSAFEGVAAEGSSPQESVGANARPSPEVMVASLDSSVDLSEVAPSQVLLASVATTGSIGHQVTLSGLDPLDALEDKVLEVETESVQEAAEAEFAEVKVATLNIVVPAAPRTPDALRNNEVLGSLPLVEVSNGTGRLDMAARIRDHLEAEGIVVKRLTNADDYRHQETVIFYRSGWRAYAEKLARMLPAVIDLDGRPEQEADVRLELGGDLLDFDRGLYYAIKKSNRANRS